MTRKAYLYLVAVLVCAGGAVFLARNQILARGRTEKRAPDTTKVLIASDAIKFGAPIRYSTSEGEEGNTAFAPWPKKYVPEGAITSPEQLEGRELVATTRFVRHLPILESMVQTREEFVPPEASVEYFTFDPDELTRVRPGQRIDILKIDRNKRVQPFIRCAEVYAIGELPRAMRRNEGSGKKHANRIYVLLPKDLRETVIEAKLNLNLILRESIHDCGEDKLAELIKDPNDARARKARQALQEAEGLMEARQYEAAVEKFQHIVQTYPALPESRKASSGAQKGRKALAQQMLNEAQQAYREEDYERAARLTQNLTEQFANLDAITREARKVSDRAAEKLYEIETRRRYRQLLEDLKASLTKGNFPRVEQLLAQLRDDYRDLQPGPRLKDPQQAQKEARDKLEHLQLEFSTAYRILTYHLQAGNQEKAVRKLQEMQKSFSEHPLTMKARERMKQRGWIK